MELTNKRQLFTVVNTATSVKLSGEITIIEGNLISNFNGNFSSLSEPVLEAPAIGMRLPLGTFNYSESATTYNKNVNGVAKEQSDEVNKLLDDTITEIKNQLEL